MTWPTASEPGSSTGPRSSQRFELVLDFARRIGPITEIHNYWIDRKSQANVRRLALRAGARLVLDGVFDVPDDVFYLHQCRGRGPAARSRRSPIAHRRAPRRARPPPAALAAACRRQGARCAERPGGSVRRRQGRVDRGRRPARHRRVRGRRPGHGARRPHLERVRSDPARRHHRLPVLEPVLGAGVHDRRRARDEHRRRPVPRRGRRARVRPARPSSAWPARPRASSTAGWSRSTERRGPSGCCDRTSPAHRRVDDVEHAACRGQRARLRG